MTIKFDLRDECDTNSVPQLCIKCSNDRRDREPGGDTDDASDGSGSGNSDDSSYGDSSDEGTSTMAGAMSGMTLTNGTTSMQTSITGGVTLPSSSGIASYRDPGARVASSSGGPVTAGSSSATRNVTPPHLRAKTVTASEASFVTGAKMSTRRAAPSVHTEQTSGNGKFAKVRSVRLHPLSTTSQ